MEAVTASVPLMIKVFSSSYVDFCSVMLLQFREEDFRLRNLTKHLRYCDKLEKGPYDQYSKRYGINSRSAFAQLRYFNFCNGSLVTDIMHDILEGVLQYETKLVLYHFVYTKKFFKLAFLNRQIEHSELGFMESANRPTPIKKATLCSSDHSLKQNGMG